MDEHVMRTYLRQEEVFVDGHGARLRTEDGREFLDFLGGIAVSALGHAHPRIVEALQDQAGKVLHTSNLYRHPYTEKVATLLAELSGLEAVFFTNSGAEANECALKLARKYHELNDQGERNHFVALEGGFHGRTLGALSVTSGEPYRTPFAPLLETEFVPRNDIAALEQALSKRPAALILEPIQGEGGIVSLSGVFLQAARQLCDETGTVLIHDEVQCGTGRTGTFLAGQHYGITPDLVTLAKPLAAGLPIGCCIARKGFDEVLRPGDHGSTFAGGPLVTRAALIVLEELRDGLLEQVRVRGNRLRQGLQRLAEKHDRIVELRGRGLMQGLRLSEGAPDLHAWLYRHGLITNCTQGTVIRMVPPYVVTEQDVDDALDLLDRGLRTLEEDSSTAASSEASA